MPPSPSQSLFPRLMAVMDALETASPELPPAEIKQHLTKAAQALCEGQGLHRDPAQIQQAVQHVLDPKSQAMQMSAAPYDFKWARPTSHEALKQARSRLASPWRRWFRLGCSRDQVVRGFWWSNTAIALSLLVAFSMA